MNTPSQPKTLEEIMAKFADDLINYDRRMTEVHAPEVRFVGKYIKKSLTGIQALIEREVIGSDIDSLYEVEGSSVAKYYVNKRLATQRQNLSKLIRGEEL